MSSKEDLFLKTPDKQTISVSSLSSDKVQLDHNPNQEEKNSALNLSPETFNDQKVSNLYRDNNLS